MLSNIVKYVLTNSYIFHSSFFTNYLFKDLTLANSSENVETGAPV